MKSVYGQFGNPRGLLGSLVGHLMAFKNRARSEWVLSQLAPRPGERILEVGFGPGVDVRRLLVAVGPSGSVAGVDVSSVMVAQARARNAEAVRERRAQLVTGSVDALPFERGEFDAVVSINCAPFWPELAAGMREIRRVTKRSGRAVIAVQPMQRGASEAHSQTWAERLASAANEAAFHEIQAALSPHQPPVAAVLLRAS